MIRVVLPANLCILARVEGEVALAVPSPVSQRTLLDALEARYPMLQGTIRDHGTKKRRAFLRYFACERDISFEGMEVELPKEVVDGKEPFMVVGAIAGG